MVQSSKARNVNDSMGIDKSNASKSVASHDDKVMHFFTGTYKGRLGKVDSTRRALVGHVPVLVYMGSGVMKKTIVSVWSITRPHPEKPGSFA
eukprot:10585110-Ditylum_brightwellii.AAC.1